MESLLRNLIGQKVSIYSGEGNSDEGMLENYDDQFVLLRKDRAQHLYIGIARIRLIKPVK